MSNGRKKEVAYLIQTAYKINTTYDNKVHLKLNNIIDKISWSYLVINFVHDHFL